MVPKDRPKTFEDIDLKPESKFQEVGGTGVYLVTQVDKFGGVKTVQLDISGKPIVESDAWYGAQAEWDGYELVPDPKPQGS